MKNLMVMLAAAIGLGFAASAATSYDYYSESYVSYYSDIDKTPGDSHSGWYSCYWLTQEDAQNVVGSSKTVTYADYAIWLSENFAVNKKATIDKAMSVPYYWYSEDDEQYGFENDLAIGPSGQSSLGIYFFDDGNGNLAYNVLSEYENIFCGDDLYASSSGWQLVSVPEPTSGLLLLVGGALLALRRKRLR